MKSIDIKKLINGFPTIKKVVYHSFLTILLGVTISVCSSVKEEKSDDSTAVASSGVEVPYIVVTSDTHISAPEGRWPFTTGRFITFLEGLENKSPDLLFITGDIIDNYINTTEGVLSGDEEHWLKEVKIYKSLIEQFSFTKFLHTYGPGHDFGDLQRVEKELGDRKGVFKWRSYDLIWVTVKKRTFANASVTYSDSLAHSDDYKWIENQLKHSGKAILLFHVPIRTDVTYKQGKWSNNTNLTIDPRDSLYNVIDIYSHKISAIFNGHIHQPIRSDYNGIPMYICPFFNSGCHCILQDNEGSLIVDFVGCSKIIK